MTPYGVMVSNKLMGTYMGFLILPVGVILVSACVFFGRERGICTWFSASLGHFDIDSYSLRLGSTVYMYIYIYIYSITISSGDNQECPLFPVPSRCPHTGSALRGWEEWVAGSHERGCQWGSSEEEEQEDPGSCCSEAGAQGRWYHSYQGHKEECLRPNIVRYSVYSHLHII